MLMKHIKAIGMSIDFSVFLSTGRSIKQLHVVSEVKASLISFATLRFSNSSARS